MRFEGARGECNEELGEDDAELRVIAASCFGDWTRRGSRRCCKGVIVDELDGREGFGSLILQEAI